jgi:hypothetical protein
MRSLDVKGALRRRWYLLVAGLLATGGLLAAAVSLVGPTHEIKSSVLLLPPEVAVVGYPATEAPGNPFLRLDGMDPVVSILVTQMTSKQVSDQMLAGQPGGGYQVVQDPLTDAPIIVVTATAPNDAEAKVIRDRVIEAMPGALQDLQVEASVPPKARITLTDLVVDARASTVWKGLVRILILIAGAGIVGTVMLVGAVDAIARSRADARRRRLEPTARPTTAQSRRPAGAPSPRPRDPQSRRPRDPQSRRSERPTDPPAGEDSHPPAEGDSKPRSGKRPKPRAGKGPKPPIAGDAEPVGEDPESPVGERVPRVPSG